MGMIVYCSATSNPTESMFTCTLLFHFISDCFLGHLVKKKLAACEPSCTSPHFALPTDVNVVCSLSMLLFRKKNLFICVYRDINEQDAWFVCVRVCVCVYESIIRVCACACCGHPE